MGYKNVHEYYEGLPEWMKRGYPVEINSVYPKLQVPSISAQGLKEMIARKENIMILDIRDDEDRRSGWIKGSTHMDIEILDDRFKELPKDKKIVIVDFRGKQSYTAARFLASKGFKDLAALDGGFAGLPAEFPVGK